jgi:membrane-bound ClpP family serine protease
LETIILIVVIGLLSFELLEHVLFPIFFFLVRKKKRELCGPERLLGKEGEVRKWRQTEGYVWVDGELWKASGDLPLKKGDKVIIKKAEGLALRVSIPEVPPS